MTVQMKYVIGREPELETIESFLGGSHEGPSALLLEGDAGIGKTTLWQAGIDAAQERGFRVLIARIGASETKLSFTVLSDLLEPVVVEALPELPEPQRQALEVAMLREGATGPERDQLAVSLAALGVLRSVARDRPILVALDDLQWMDGPSTRVLRFALRRLREEPIGVLASVRVGTAGADRLALDRTLPAHRVRRVFLGPMPPEALGRLIRDRIGTDLPHPVLRRVHGLAGGNPFFALEIAKELARRGVPAAGEAFPVPDDVRVMLRDRLEALPRTTRGILLAAAATSRPTERLVGAASGLGPRATPALARAERAGVVRIEGGRIAFTHPLLASTVSEAASADERRRVHRRLAEHVADLEARARHLALGSDGPDPEVAAALDEASHLARARGAPDAAAELAELARRLTPVEDAKALRQRAVQAAQHHFDAGDAARSRALLEEAIASAPPGLDRARILFLSGSREWMDLSRVGRACEQALSEAGDDAELVSAAHEHLAWVAIYRGDLAAASRHAIRATQHAGSISSPAHRAEALATFGMTQFLIGQRAETIMSEADRLQDLEMTRRGLEATVYTSARTNHGLQLLWAGELDAAREILQRELNAYEQRGRYLVRDEVLGYLAELECRAGNWALAARYAEEALEIDVESGRISGEGHTLFNTALVAAHQGDVGLARSRAEEGLRISVANEDPFYTSCNRGVLGFLELSASNPSGALEHLLPVVAYLREMGSPEPGIIPRVPDAIEGLVAVGEIDQAETLLEEHHERGRRPDRPWALVTAMRCQGLLQAARGDAPVGLETLERAVEEHERVGQPFELARTLLVRGEVARRAKRKVLARESLEGARSIFDRLGARLWSEKSRAELARVGGTPGGGKLTATERRIADLVVEGMTNRQIADALFISVKTVEANLSRVFHKLGVRSRAQLIASIVSAGQELETSGSDPET
ncbi:MAG TPA: AAA family ATPase [Actinomycetota bacterium]|nr:AAA family ATPase [Actinomycetota bacterium]